MVKLGPAPSIAVVGDCLLDVAVRPDALADRGADVPAAIRLGAGGQGANVAVRLARRGRAVRLVAPIGHDAVGELLRAVLATDGVDLARLPAKRSGTVAALIDPGGERTMYSDRPRLDGAGAVAAVEGCGWIHVSGYALLGDDGRALAEGLAGRFVSVNGGSAAARDGRAAQLLAQLRTLRPALIVLSAAEVAALLDGPLPPGTTAPTGFAPDPGDAARLVAQQLGSLVVVTDAARGAHAAWPEGGGVRAAARSVQAVDATGAGDAFAAAVIDELANAAWPPDEERMRGAMAAGAMLAARVVTVIGAQARVPGELEPSGPGEGQGTIST